MLNVKKLLTKILKSKLTWDYVGDVYWWGNTWTVPDDGFIEVHAEPSGNNWYLRISDTLAPDTGWSHRMAGANNATVSQIFFVKKGAVLKTYSMSAISTIHVYYFKFNSWGGVLHNRITVNHRKVVAVC